MAFSLRIYIVIVTIVLVQCNAEHWSEPEDFNEYRETNCKDVRLQMGHTMRNSICKPRETHVYLKPKPGYEFRPPMISAKRCRGHCAPGLTPMPTQTKQSEFAIQMHPAGNPAAGLKCVLVKVEEHTKCRCQCSKKEEDCKPDQIYHANRCSCKCKDREIRRHYCEAGSGKVWNDDDCSCNCPEMDSSCPKPSLERFNLHMPK